jgi:hypothetical protein
MIWWLYREARAFCRVLARAGRVIRGFLARETACVRVCVDGCMASDGMGGCVCREN